MTGASGFIGRTLLQLLIDEGFEAIGVSRSPMSDLPSLRVTQYSDTIAADVLIHLAENRDCSDTEGTRHNCDIPADKMLNSLIAKGFGKVIYASSVAVYGDRTSKPHRVRDPVDGDSFYTRTKISCEKVVLRAGGVVARISNIYGPGMASNNVVSKLLSQIPGEGPVRVWDTNPVRDFIWIDDVAQALMVMACSAQKGVYNVGSGTGTSVADLACLMLEEAGEQNRNVISTRPSNRPSVNIVDISATMRKFNWKPLVGIKEGIRLLMQMRRVGDPV